MTAKTTAAGVPYDVQGDMSDTDRRDAAMRGFVHEFGAVAAAHLESCVRCGMCANACHFYVSTGNPSYTPINKLRPFEQAYHRHAGPFAPIYRLFGIAPKVTITELEEWERLIYDACTLCGRCTLACPMGIDIAELIKEARHGMFKAGLVPDRLQLMDRDRARLDEPRDSGRGLRRHHQRSRRGAWRRDACRSRQGRLSRHRRARRADRPHQGARRHRQDPQQDRRELDLPHRGLRGLQHRLHQRRHRSAEDDDASPDQYGQEDRRPHADPARMWPRLWRGAVGGGALVRRQAAGAHHPYDGIPAGDRRLRAR